MAEVVASLESSLALQERRDSSMFEGDIFNISGDYETQENTNSSNIELVDFGDASRRQSRVKAGKMMAFTKMLRLFLSRKSQDILGAFYKVYKGRLADGSVVAVKRLKVERTQVGELQFQTELKMISMADHRNLLRPLGFCVRHGEWLLVYPYMCNGSVASFLKGRSECQTPLSWLMRAHIALGSARGLAYLHDQCNPKIIHGNVKTENILLNENFEAFVGNFGLAKLMDYPDTHVTTAVSGTIGHRATEDISTREYSEKTDVFWYGVMLLELITGFNLTRLSNEDIMLFHWIRGLLKENKLETLVDVNMQGNYLDEDIERLMQVALLCTQVSPMERPKMAEVVKILEGNGFSEKWEDWQNGELFRQELSNTHIDFTCNLNTSWILADSTFNLHPCELSSPR